MKLQNGYKVIYNARKAVTEEKPNLLYGSQGVPALEDPMLHYYGNGEEITAEDIRKFKLVYNKGNYLFGSLTGIPSEDDTILTLKDGNGLVVFGEDGGEPVVKYELKFVPVENVIFGGAGKYSEDDAVELTVRPADGYMFGEDNHPVYEFGGEIKEFELDGDIYKAEFLMPAEAVVIDVTGIVVEEKPVAHEGYYKVLLVEDRGESVELDNTWTAIETVPADKLALTTDNEDLYYVCYALKGKDATEMYGDDDRTVKAQNLLKAGEEFYDKSAQEFNGANYSVYVAKSGDGYQLNGKHDFDIYF